MSKKYLGIFYKNLWLQLHYIPLALIGLGMTNLVLYWFKINLVHPIWLNIILGILFYITFTIGDQLVHSILDLIGIHD